MENTKSKERFSKKPKVTNVKKTHVEENEMYPGVLFITDEKGCTPVYCGYALSEKTFKDAVEAMMEMKAEAWKYAVRAAMVHIKINNEKKE